MDTLEMMIPVLTAGLAWLWLDSAKAREAGIAEVRRACQAEGVQLLDETIALARLRPTRTQDGWLALRRVYEFEYSDTGDNRRRGSVHLLGQAVTLLNLGPRPVPPPSPWRTD
jgi:hypothetical protein